MICRERSVPSFEALSSAQQRREGDDGKKLGWMNLFVFICFSGLGEGVKGVDRTIGNVYSRADIEGAV